MVRRSSGFPALFKADKATAKFGKLTADHTEEMGCPDFDAIEEVCAGRNGAAFYLAD